MAYFEIGLLIFIVCAMWSISIFDFDNCVNCRSELLGAFGWAARRAIFWPIYLINYWIYCALKILKSFI